MTAKQLSGSTAPDGSNYVCQTNGNGTLTLGGTKQLKGNTAPDRSGYITLTDGNGNLV